MKKQHISLYDILFFDVSDAETIFTVYKKESLIEKVNISVLKSESSEKMMSEV